MKIKKNSKKAFSILEATIILIVFGLVIAGFTGGARLINLSKLIQARNDTGSSPIHLIPGLRLWLETTGEESFTVETPDNGDSIALWKDTNPQSKLKFNASATDQPAYNTNSINGLPALKFTDAGASGSYMLFDDDSLFENINSRSVFIIAKPNDTAPAPNAQIFGESYSGVTFSMIHSDSERLRVTVSDLINPSTTLYSTSTIPHGTTFLFFVEYSDPNAGGNGDLNLYLNGKQEATTNYSYSLGNAPSSRVAIGRYVGPGGNVRSFNGDIGEIIMFNRVLDSEERVLVEKYLSKKWKLNLN